MASITISGGGSIPSRSKGFTSDETPDGHSKLFEEVAAYIGAWKTETEKADAEKQS
jgi:hypothetical protein